MHIFYMFCLHVSRVFVWFFYKSIKKAAGFRPFLPLALSHLNTLKNTDYLVADLPGLKRRKKNMFLILYY